jgi:hypothetical protein
MNNVPRRSGEKCDCMDLYGAGTRSATLDDWTVGRGKGEQGVLEAALWGKYSEERGEKTALAFAAKSAATAGWPMLACPSKLWVNKVQALPGLAGVEDYPIGEGMPEGGFCEGKAELLDENQEGAGPKSGAMNLVGGPEVVGNQKEKKNFAA